MDLKETIANDIKFPGKLDKNWSQQNFKWGRHSEKMLICLCRSREYEISDYLDEVLIVTWGLLTLAKFAATAVAICDTTISTGVSLFLTFYSMAFCSKCCLVECRRALISSMVQLKLCVPFTSLTIEKLRMVGDFVDFVNLSFCKRLWKAWFTPPMLD